MNYLGKEAPETFNNKTVFVRVDFDVSFNEKGEIVDDFRIKRCFPTIDYLISKKAKVVLGTKLGNPKKDNGFSCERLLSCLSNISHLQFVKDYSGEEAQKAISDLKDGEVLLLENLRLFPEEWGDEAFAQKFSSNFDFYVNEAFAMCHDSDTSVALLPKYLTSYAGFNLQKEVEVLSTVLKNPQRPLILIVGGAKIESKLPIITSFLDKADKIIIGGKLAQSQEAQKFANNPKVFLATCDSSGFDISQGSVGEILSNLSNLSKEGGKGTIVWAGPVGKFEEKEHENGTKMVAQALANSSAYKIAGGGDTITAINKFGLATKFDFLSTGGGAMLQFINGKILLGLKVLE
ncbi:phosphoglycerate kinase [Candidatus Parcubacteria bacterium]|nr:phosphoglycerate kinase [Patescibacteria group bacterium]MBU4380786.1 phosphoglycerate kinase [Patescibacteria group bacterium]MCG2689089.1 phosphoglycerate kinase [Candidatus Parcubacteria bacterium]